MSSAADSPEISAGESREHRCGQCGASCAVEATRCWLCNAPLSAAIAGASGAPAPAQQFSLATILLVITLIAVCLGTFRISPGFGIAVICFSVPALIRTVVVGVQNKSVGQRLTIGDKLRVFAASLGIMVLVGIAAFVAFQIACWGTCGLITAANSRSLPSDAGFMTSVVIGSIAALAIGIWILWLTRPRWR